MVVTLTAPDEVARILAQMQDGDAMVVRVLIKNKNGDFVRTRRIRLVAEKDEP